MGDRHAVDRQSVVVVGGAWPRAESGRLAVWIILYK
jgi:hypothetical protein